MMKKIAIWFASIDRSTNLSIDDHWIDRSITRFCSSSRENDPHAKQQAMKTTAKSSITAGGGGA